MISFLYNRGQRSRWTRNCRLSWARWNQLCVLSFATMLTPATLFSSSKTLQVHKSVAYRARFLFERDINLITLLTPFSCVEIFQRALQSECLDGDQQSRVERKNLRGQDHWRARHQQQVYFFLMRFQFMDRIFYQYTFLFQVRDHLSETVA